MAKAFRTFEMIRGKEAMLRHIVCECRYSDGSLYLDRCGRLLRKILGEMPEWVVAPEPNPKATLLHNLSTGVQLGFGRESASLSLDRSTTDEIIGTDDISEFQRQVESVLCVVLDELEVTEFGRIGYREFHHFSFETKEESEAWIRTLGLVTVSPALFKSYNATMESLGTVIVLEGPNCHYRIGLNGIERAAQVPIGDTTLAIRASATSARQRHVLIQTLKQQRARQINSAYAVVLDVDAYLIDPAGADLSEFVVEQHNIMLNTFKDAVGTETPKRK